MRCWPIRRSPARRRSRTARRPRGALPDTLPEDDDREAPVDPFAPHEPLPRRRATTPKGRARGDTPREVVKTALTFEARGGHVRAFMPPLVRIEAYAQLIAE